MDRYARERNNTEIQYNQQTKDTAMSHIYKLERGLPGIQYMHHIHHHCATCIPPGRGDLRHCSATTKTPRMRPTLSLNVNVPSDGHFAVRLSMAFSIHYRRRADITGQTWCSAIEGEAVEQQMNLFNLLSIAFLVDAVVIASWVIFLESRYREPDSYGYETQRNERMSMSAEKIR